MGHGLETLGVHKRMRHTVLKIFGEAHGVRAGNVQENAGMARTDSGASSMVNGRNAYRLNERQYN